MDMKGDLGEALEAIEVQLENGVPSQKDKIRREISDKMKKKPYLKKFDHHNPNNLDLRIPYFVGCEQAARKVGQLREFRAANVVKVNPSLAQMELRKLCLMREKKLLTPPPSLTEEHFMSLLDGTQAQVSGQARRASSKAGAARIGQLLTVPELEERRKELRVDMVVVGAVAVSKNGVRLGKGKGLAEMEWAVLHTLGMVDQNTKVVTTVHEAQITHMSTSLMMEHDLPVDIIVTPKRIINVRPKLKKPERGILWDDINQNHLSLMPFLKDVWDIEKKL